MSEDVKVPKPEKIPAHIIMEQLGYRVRVVEKRGTVKPREVASEVRKTKNGRAISDFDTLMSSVRSVKVQHKRTATAKLQEVATREGTGTKFKGAL